MVARGLAEAMGGTVEPEETPGGGLTMVVSLPAAPARPAAGVGARPIRAAARHLGRRAGQPRAHPTALLGIARFVLFAALGVIVIRTERPLTGLEKRLLSERDTIRAVLDGR